MEKKKEITDAKGISSMLCSVSVMEMTEVNSTPVW